MKCLYSEKNMRVTSRHNLTDSYRITCDAWRVQASDEVHTIKGEQSGNKYLCFTRK